MPEKPEVVTVAKKLKNHILGRTIQNCNIDWDNIIAYPTTKEFQEKIKNQMIHSISTRGKFIVIELDDYNLLIHLRMEGKFLFRKPNEFKTKHEHIEFILDDNISWRYHDVRKFGKMYLIAKEDTYKVKPLKDLGLEYDDPSLTSTYLKEKLKNKTLPIKTVLLDQSIITGIGNIYDDEILFLSHINPYKKASSLTKKNCEDIIQNTKIVLDHAIKLGGTTIKSFTSEEGVHGLFQNELQIHGKKGEKCPNCNSIIVKEMIHNRGTYYCKNCQK
ncbi:MAG: DNA-formamidopyrimidine glycosylase [Bacilli bacterium]|nr:DNA-formamidopyrimidine glycosylase [Bacilli bacterium]